MFGVEMTYALGDEYTNHQTGDEEDNDEYDNDTGLALCPVVTLGQLGHGVLAASDERHIESGHCECVIIYSSISQIGPERDILQICVATAGKWTVQARARTGRVSFRIGKWSTANTSRTRTPQHWSLRNCENGFETWQLLQQKRYGAYLLVETVLCRSDIKSWDID